MHLHRKNDIEKFNTQYLGIVLYNFVMCNLSNDSILKVHKNQYGGIYGIKTHLKHLLNYEGDIAFEKDLSQSHNSAIVLSS